MQLYTQILLGMAIGATVGLTLGPNSTLLDHNFYKITNAASVHLRLDRTDPATEVKLPMDVAIGLIAMEAVTESRPDIRGRTAEVPVWVRVQCPFSRQLALHDPTGALRRRLGAAKIGDWVEVRDLPFLEMAKDVTITPAASRICSLLRNCGEEEWLSFREKDLRFGKLYIPGDEDDQDDEESSLPT